MRWGLLALVVGCGTVPGAEDAGDAGLDAGQSGPPYLWTCKGYTSCLGPDGGPDPQPFSRTYCAVTSGAAQAMFHDAGEPRLSDGGQCPYNGDCREQGTHCSP